MGKCLDLDGFFWYNLKICLDFGSSVYRTTQAFQASKTSTGRFVCYQSRFYGLKYHCSIFILKLSFKTNMIFIHTRFFVSIQGKSVYKITYQITIITHSWLQLKISDCVCPLYTTVLRDPNTNKLCQPRNDTWSVLNRSEINKHLMDPMFNNVSL